MTSDDDHRTAQAWLSAFRRLLDGDLPAFVLRPPMDVLLREDALEVVIEVPGIDPQLDLSVEAEGRFLTIRGERRRTSRHEPVELVHIERTHGTFVRRVPLPGPVDADHLTVSYQDGLVHVVVPLGADTPAPAIQMSS
jgi:HSP20 family protein